MEKVTNQMAALNMAIMTVSDTRSIADDRSGDLLVAGLQSAGHQLVARTLLADNRYVLRAQLSAWIADEAVQVVITTGGTGITGRDVTPEAVMPLLDKSIEGFGELFRQLSFADIGTSTLQSRAVAGVANGTLIFCLPGSTGACRLAWEKILLQQLDITHKPCNFVQLLPRLLER